MTLIGCRCKDITIGNKSENGTVARGICSKDADENLTTCVERTEIMRIDGKVSYKDEQGEWVAVENASDFKRILNTLPYRAPCR